MNDSKILELLEFSLSNLDITDILTKVVEKIREEIGAERSTLFLYNEEENVLESVVLEADKLKKVKIPVNLDSIAGFVAIKKQIVNIKNVYDYKELKSIDKELKYHKSWIKVPDIATQSMIALPILIGNKLLGIFVASNKEPHFTEEDKKLLEKFIPILANVLNYALLVEEIKRQNILSENIINEMKEGVIIVDKNDKITNINPSFIEITGNRWNRKDVLGKDIKEIFSNIVKNKFYEKLAFVKEYLITQEYIDGIIKIKIIPITFDMFGETKLKNVVFMVEY